MTSSLAQRRVEPEWLDQLAADDPRAVRARRDLRRVNACMGHADIMARTLTRHYAGATPRVVLDLGAGDGTFMLALAQHLATRWQNVHVRLLDRQASITGETRAEFVRLHWPVEAVVADVFAFFEEAQPRDIDLILANLFLHHFAPEKLARLLALAAQSTRMFVACEPRRGTAALLGSRLLWVIGCNGVSRHDAPVSVRAGFREKELSALWPREEHWMLREYPVPPFTHTFVARRAKDDPL